MILAFTIDKWKPLEGFEKAVTHSYLHFFQDHPGYCDEIRIGERMAKAEAERAIREFL